MIKPNETQAIRIIQVSETKHIYVFKCLNTTGTTTLKTSASKRLVLRIFRTLSISYLLHLIKEQRFLCGTTIETARHTYFTIITTNKLE